MGRVSKELEKKRSTILHILNAWSVDGNVVLGQIKSEKGANEIKTVPELLSMLDIKGCTVTLDAMGCQNGITEKIAS